MSGSINQIEAQLDHDIIFISQYFGDSVSNPFFYNLEVDLLHVNLLAKLGGESGRLQKSRIYPSGHIGEVAIAV